jgi:PadR family transcriptional regulator, regulatory protein PadR
MDDQAAFPHRSGPHSRFEFAPPRRFLLPAILLLLAEQPGYGYSLVKELQTFGFGQVDRPSVYRALGQLETDGLVEASLEAPKAGSERRVYRLTAHGERILRAWMGVIKDERDHLDDVLRRYRATGTVDAVMADVDGGWCTSLGPDGSAISCTSRARRPKDSRLRIIQPASSPQAGPPDPPPAAVPPMAPDRVAPDWPEANSGMQCFAVIPDRSVILVEVRSSVGPLSFGAIGITGSIDAAVADGSIDVAAQPTAHLEIGVDGLHSGNGLYDAELLRRIDARRFPRACIDLGQTTAIGSDGRFRLAGEVTFHGVTRPAQGAVQASLKADQTLVITGEQVFDIRDFAIASPTVLMLRIYPDVRVRLHVEAAVGGRW